MRPISRLAFVIAVAACATRTAPAPDALLEAAVRYMNASIRAHEQPDVLFLIMAGRREAPASLLLRLHDIPVLPYSSARLVQEHPHSPQLTAFDRSGRRGDVVAVDKVVFVRPDEAVLTLQFGVTTTETTFRLVDGVWIVTREEIVAITVV